MSSGQPRRDRRRDVLGVLGLGVMAACIVFIAFILPPFFIRETLSGGGNSWIFSGHPRLYAFFYVVVFLLYIGIIVFMFVRLYDPTEGMGYQAIALALAIVANIWLGFTIWLLTVKLLHIPAAASDPRRFGLMVWWNLLHAIPLLDINSALDWEQPMEEHDAVLGWLLLLQQIVLLLTLAQAIQMLVKRMRIPSASGPGG